MNVRRRSRGDDGSVTIWTLGMVLVVLFLGGISFDLWHAFSARRTLAAEADLAAQSGANGLDTAVYRASGVRQLDPVRAEQLAIDLLSHASLPAGATTAVAADTTAIQVDIQAEVDLGLLRIFMSGDPMIVRVQATGRIRQENP